MSAKRTSQAELPRAFSAATRALKQNQQALNEADPYNHNHGDNMVKNFQAISKAMREKKDAQPAAQLAYASEVLQQSAQSGSAQLYAQGLAQAAQRYQGKSSLNAEDMLGLVQTLMGGAAQPGGQTEQSTSAGGDMLGGLLGAFMGGGAPAQPAAAQQTNPSPSAGGDMLGGLLGAFLGGGTPAQPAAIPAAPSGQNAGGEGALGQGEGGIDLNTVLGAGMAFLQARQQGAPPLQALAQAVVAGSQMQSSVHHSQSGQLVAQTLLQSLLGGKK